VAQPTHIFRLDCVIEVPVDILRVCSSIISNFGPRVTEINAHVVRVKGYDERVPMVKIDRSAEENADLERFL